MLEKKTDLITPDNIPVIREGLRPYYDPINNEIGLLAAEFTQPRYLKDIFDGISIPFFFEQDAFFRLYNRLIQNSVPEELMADVTTVDYAETYVETLKGFRPIFSRRGYYINPAKEHELLEVLEAVKSSGDGNYEFDEKVDQFKLDVNAWDKVARLKPELFDEIQRLRQLTYDETKVLSEEDVASGEEIRRRLQVHEQTHQMDQSSQHPNSINALVRDIVAPLLKHYIEGKKPDELKNVDPDIIRITKSFLTVSSFLEAKAILYELMGSNAFDDTENYSHLTLVYRLAVLVREFRYPNQENEVNPDNLERLQIETVLDPDDIGFTSLWSDHFLTHERGTIMLLFADALDITQVVGQGGVANDGRENITPRQILDKSLELITNPDLAKQKLFEARDKIEQGLELAIEAFKAELSDLLESNQEVRDLLAETKTPPPTL